MAFFPFFDVKKFIVIVLDLKMMKFLLAIFTIFVVGRAQYIRSAEEEYFRSAQEVCAGLSQACMDNLLISLLGDTSEAEVCGELSDAISCLEKAVENCPNPDDKEEVADGLTELATLMREKCTKDVVPQESAIAQRNEQQELDEIVVCLDEWGNRMYFEKCINDGSEYAMSILSAGATEDLTKCVMFGMMASCYVQRIEEKCGDKAADMAEKGVAQLPPEIESACRNAGGVHPVSFHFQDMPVENNTVS